VLTDKQAEHAGMIIGLKPLNLKMMFGLAIAVETQLIGVANIAAYFFEKTLIEFRALASHPLLDLVATSDDAGLHEVEFHRCRPFLG
jgi:hypothetical protein